MDAVKIKYDFNFTVVTNVNESNAIINHCLILLKMIDINNFYTVFNRVDGIKLKKSWAEQMAQHVKELQ